MCLDCSECLGISQQQLGNLAQCPAGKTKSGKEKCTPDSKGKGEHVSAATQSHLEEVRVCKANGRTYITGVFGEPGRRALVVEISERMSCNHVKVIESVA